MMTTLTLTTLAIAQEDPTSRPSLPPTAAASAEPRGVDPSTVPPSPRIPPHPNEDDPQADLARDFHEGLGSITEAARSRARLEQARRLAPFDLEWGLE